MANFATLEQIRPFILAGLYNKLSSIVSGSTTYFSLVASEVDKFIRDRTGNPIPDVAGSVDWIVYPYALLVQKFSSNLIENVSPEHVKKIVDDFTLALKILDSHPYLDPTTGEESPTDNSKSHVGSIDGLVDFNPIDGGQSL